MWDAFAAELHWVVGVAGNHDTFAGGATRPKFTGRVHYLDNDQISIGGVSIAGLSGITGNPRRPWRRTDDAYADTLACSCVTSRQSRSCTMDLTCQDVDSGDHREF